MEKLRDEDKKKELQTEAVVPIKLTKGSVPEFPRIDHEKSVGKAQDKLPLPSLDKKVFTPPCTAGNEVGTSLMRVIMPLS